MRIQFLVVNKSHVALPLPPVVSGRRLCLRWTRPCSDTSGPVVPAARCLTPPRPASSNTTTAATWTPPSSVTTRRRPPSGGPPTRLCRRPTGRRSRRSTSTSTASWSTGATDGSRAVCGAYCKNTPTRASFSPSGQVDLHRGAGGGRRRAGGGGQGQGARGRGQWQGTGGRGRGDAGLCHIALSISVGRSWI